MVTLTKGKRMTDIYVYADDGHAKVKIPTNLVCEKNLVIEVEVDDKPRFFMREGIDIRDPSEVGSRHFYEVPHFKAVEE